MTTTCNVDFKPLLIYQFKRFPFLQVSIVDSASRLAKKPLVQIGTQSHPLLPCVHQNAALTKNHLIIWLFEQLNSAHFLFSWLISRFRPSSACCRYLQYPVSQAPPSHAKPESVPLQHLPSHFDITSIHSFHFISQTLIAAVAPLRLLVFPHTRQRVERPSMW